MSLRLLRWRKACCASLAAALAATLLPSPAAAQAKRDLGVVDLRPTGFSQAQRLYGESHALVIGASRYSAGWSELPGVRGDVTAVTQLLQGQGFKVQTLSDPTRSSLDATLRRFAVTHGANPANRLLVYFAGHGHTLTSSVGKKLGYLVPVDAPRPDRDMAGFRELAYSMENFEQLSRQIEARHVLFLFDSCFSGTVFRARSDVPDAISELTEKPVRLFITAGDESQKVPDESIFRRQLERALGTEAAADVNRDGFITGTELGSYLHEQVTNYSKRSQTPRWGKLNDPDLDRGDYVFLNARKPAGVTGTVVPEPVKPPVLPGETGGLSLEDLKKEEAARQEWARWQARMKADYDAAAGFSGSADLQAKAWERFLAGWGQDNPYSQEDEALRHQAQQRREQAQGRAREEAQRLAQPSPAPQPTQAQAGSAQTFSVNGVSFRMVSVPSGSFQMGSPASEPGRAGDEGPQRRVSVPAFQLGQTEVTQGLWQAVMGSNPSRFSDCGPECPVERVSWDEAQEFIRKLNQQTGQQFRLPSEAEWEYAARAGSTTPYPWGNTASHEQANYGKDECCDGLAQGRDRWVNTAPVSQFPANAFGLHDMHGNVREWVQDCYADSYRKAPSDGRAANANNCSLRVLRGGSWSINPRWLRSAYRIRSSPDIRFVITGFRLARTVF